MNSIRHSIFFSLLEKYAGFIVNFCTIVVLSRLLTPAETGLYSIAAALINIAQILREFGVYSYILQEKDLTEEKLGSAVGVSLAIAAVLTVLFIVSAQPIAAFYEAPSLSVLIFILSWNFLLVAYSAVGHGVMVRNSSFRSNMYIATTSAIVSSAVSITLAYYGLGALCLAWASLAGCVASLIGNVIVLGRQAIVPPNFRHLRAVMNIGVFSGCSGLLGAICYRAPDLLIGRIIGLEAAGLYSRGGGLVVTVRELITGAVVPVISSLFAKTHREAADLQESYLLSLRYVCIIAWPALAVLGVLAYPVIDLVFGARWVPSAPVAQMLCLGSGLGLLGWFAQTLTSSTGAVRHTLIIQSVAAPVTIGCIAGGACIGLTAAAAGAAASAAIVSLVCIIVLRRHVSLRVWSVVKELAPAVVAASASALASGGVAYLMGSSPRCVVPAGIAGVVTWLASIHLLRHPVRFEVHMVLRKVFALFRRVGRGMSASSE